MTDERKPEGELEFLRGFFIRIMASYHLEDCDEDDTCPILSDEAESEEATRYLEFLKTQAGPKVDYCYGTYNGAGDLWDRLPKERAAQAEERRKQYAAYEAKACQDRIRDAREARELAKEAQELDEAFAVFMEEVAANKARRELEKVTNNQG